MRTHRTVPFVTLTLAFITTVIEIARLASGHYSDRITANLDVLTWPDFYNQPWRVFTSPFVHRNIAAFLVNVAFLLQFGWQIERKHGWALFLAVFFGALVTAYVLWTNVAHDWIVGISIGVCGLFGFSLIANRLSPWWRTLTHRPLHALFLLNLIVAVIVDVTQLIPGRVAHLAHFFGILYGMAFGAAFLLTPQSAHWRAVVLAVPVLLFASLLCSPWQVEWRLVKTPPKLVTANADCRLQSPIQDVYIPAPITFVNASTKPIAVYWLNYEGNPQFMLWLGPSDSAKDNAFVGHPFCIVDRDTEEALQVVMVREPKQTIIIH